MGRNAITVDVRIKSSVFPHLVNKGYEEFKHVFRHSFVSSIKSTVPLIAIQHCKSHLQIRQHAGLL